MFQLRNTKGFTLIEVLLALGIVAFMASVVVPSLASSYENLNFKKTLNETEQLLNLASTYSRSMNQEVVVSVNRTGGKVSSLSVLKTSPLSQLDTLEIKNGFELITEPVITSFSFSPTSSVRLFLGETQLNEDQNLQVKVRASYTYADYLTVFYYSGAIQRIEPNK